jgi:hypothetical protein
MSNTLSNFTKGDKVAYIPAHASGDISHEDVERGEVSSTNHKFVFVKFDNSVKKFGWEGTASQAVLPEDLIILSNRCVL